MNDKIKNLLATAYKTDSIAKNKWRIENREQLREQRKRELKELMEKDNEMSNNKQSSVEWLLSFIEPSLTQEQKHFFSMVIEQAKEINKEQHRQTANVVRQAIFDLNYSSFDEYYNETFGGNNEQQ